MKVETEELPDSEVALSFEVESIRVEQALDAAARRLAQRVNVPGFRRGKAPRALLERVIGKESLMEEALDHLLPEIYQEVVQEQHLRPLTEPEFDVQSVSPLRAKATVVVPPAVTLGDYGSIRHDLPEPKVSQEDITSALNQLRERHAEWVPAGRPAAMGDRVIMHVHGEEADGATVVRPQDADYLLEPERASPVPGFAEAAVGMEVDQEREFDLAVPAEHEHEELAGKTVHFSVAVREVLTKELPELDDYFASTVGEYTSLEALREKVEEELLREAREAAEQQTQREIVEQAVTVSTVALPAKLLDHEMQRARDRLARNLDTYGMTTEQYNRLLGRSDAEMDESLRVRVETDLRQEFVLRAIAAQEGITVSDEEVDSRIEAVVQADGGDPRSVARITRESSIRDRVADSLLEERGARWLFEHATGSEEASPQEEGER